MKNSKIKRGEPSSPRNKSGGPRHMRPPGSATYGTDGLPEELFKYSPHASRRFITKVWLAETFLQNVQTSYWQTQLAWGQKLNFFSCCDAWLWRRIFVLLCLLVAFAMFSGSCVPPNIEAELSLCLSRKGQQRTINWTYSWFNVVGLFKDDRIVDFYYPILSCFWKMISVSDPNPVLIEIILSVSENYPKVHYDAQHVFLCCFHFALLGKISARVILPLTEHDWFK